MKLMETFNIYTTLIIQVNLVFLQMNKVIDR